MSKEDMAAAEIELAEEKVPEEIAFVGKDGCQFRIGFDRESAMKAEKMYDLSLTEATSGKSSAIYGLFASSFIKHHPKIQPGTVKALWDQMEDKQELYRTLVMMYANTAGSLLEEPDKGNGISWKTL